MALETFPELASNIIYSVLCLVPGFITLETAQFYSSSTLELDEFEKTTWSLVASGLSFFQGENSALQGGREADISYTFHRRLQTEYPTTANLH